ncbi:hypothetical protein B0H13DRAFT_2284790 [Mycena leptocephala]|nr:hypothetical protein B0H13DRAFT_2284790 [Mycena leptocephala]
MTEDECTVMVVAENRDRNGAQEQGHRPTTACMIAVPQRSGRGRQRMRKRHRLRTTRRDAMQQGEWMHEHEAQAGALSVRHSSVLLRERTHSSHVLQEGMHPKLAAPGSSVYPANDASHSQENIDAHAPCVLRLRKGHAQRDLSRVSPSSNASAPHSTISQADELGRRIVSFRPASPRLASTVEARAILELVHSTPTASECPSRPRFCSHQRSEMHEPRWMTNDEGVGTCVHGSQYGWWRQRTRAHQRTSAGKTESPPRLQSPDSAQVGPIAATRANAEATSSTSTAAPASPAGTSRPVCSWVGVARTWGRLAGTKGGGLAPYAGGSAHRCRIAAHAAAVVGARGMRAGADGGGTVAQAGAGIDSGVGGILVDVDLGRRRRVFGAVAGTGRCGGWGGGQRCLRRRCGARGSDPSKTRRDEEDYTVKSFRVIMFNSDTARYDTNLCLASHSSLALSQPTKVLL